MKETATTAARSAPAPTACLHQISLVLCFAFDAVALSNVIAADADAEAVMRTRRRRASRRKAPACARGFKEEMADFIKNLSAEFVGLRRKEVVLTSAKREVKAFLPPSYLTEKEFEDSLGGFPESVWAASLVTPFRAGVKKYFVGWANYLKINPILKEN